MESDEILRAIQQIAVDQGKVVSSLNGHVELDNERFRGMHEKLDRIDVRTEQTQKDVESLKETRTFNRGRAWMIAKVLALAGGMFTAAEVVMAFMRSK